MDDKKEPNVRKRTSHQSMSLKNELLEIFRSNSEDVMSTINSKNLDVQIVNLKNEDVKSNPYQPRKIFDEEKLNELAASIKEHGVLSPILVNKIDNNGQYTLVAGERRLLASKKAGKNDIPAIIGDFTDKQLLEISLLENLQREDLNAIEIATALNQMATILGYSQEMIAERVGKSREYVSNMIRLLKLPNDIQTDVLDNKISVGHARAILSISNEDKKRELVEKIVEQKLSVRDTEKLVKQKSPQGKELPNKEGKSDIYKLCEEELIKHLGLSNIKVDKKCIKINFSSTGELEKIKNLLIKK